jgi:hypothetical protein
MVTRKAECACGQLSAVCTGEPFRVSVCHCLDCKRRTGSAFSFNARWKTEDVTIAGRAKEFTRVGDEGHSSIFSFCPECGVTVHYRMVDQPDAVAVPAGAFADPSFPQPFVSVYHGEDRRHRWVEIRCEPLEIID